MFDAFFIKRRPKDLPRAGVDAQHAPRHYAVGDAESPPRFFVLFESSLFAQRLRFAFSESFGKEFAQSFHRWLLIRAVGRRA